MKHKVLITGANSFIGSNLTRKLVQEGFEVHCLVRENSDKWRLEGLNIKFWIGDLRERESIFEIVKKINPDIIFHLATAGIYAGVEGNEKDILDINFFGSKNLIDACDEIDYRCFVNTGSSSEYGIKNRPMNEDDVCSPMNVYGISKNMACKYGQMIAKTKNKPIVSFRIFSPYGAYDHKDRLMSYALVNALKEEDIVLNNPYGVRDYIFIKDVVELYLRAIDNAEKAKGEIFNVGSGNQEFILNVVEEIIRISNSSSRIIFGE